MSNAIEFYWDTTDPANAGWYAMERSADGEIIDDSMKVWFPVDVDEFGESDGQQLKEALIEAFPDHEVREV